MKKNYIIGIGIILVIGLIAKHLLSPVDIEPVSLESFVIADNEKSKLVIIRIGEQNELYVNDVKTDSTDIISKLDSLELIGFESTKVILDKGTRSDFELIVKLMERIQETDRKIIMKLN